MLYRQFYFIGIQSYEFDAVRLCRPVFIVSVLACAMFRALVPICRYCLNCSKFDSLILRKIIKIVATRCQILRLKCTKFDFGWGSAPDPARGAYSAPPAPSWISGAYF